ncbi:MAG TPA: hypothetical protein VHP63_02205 [candidate division Zixibacteria bacterium]|nr:hypothetical protein [candidate division Zixibacteria bacterium]
MDKEEKLQKEQLEHEVTRAPDKPSTNLGLTEDYSFPTGTAVEAQSIGKKHEPTYALGTTTAAPSIPIDLDSKMGKKEEVSYGSGKPAFVTRSWKIKPDETTD